jgi:transcriptional regulator GlxA family with amidase domain
LRATEDRFSTLLAEDLSLSILANRAGMSERSFSRHNVEASGQPPARVIERLRLEAAQNMLLESRLAVKRIARHCGFGSEAAMRRGFPGRPAVTP